MALSPNRLLRLLALLTTLLFLSACGSQPGGQVPADPTPGPTETTMPVPQEPTPAAAEPTPVLQPYANITKEQYEEAIAKWRTSGVLRYRIRLNYGAFSLFGGSWTLTVNSSAGRPVVEEYAAEQGGRNAGATPTPEDLHNFTIEGLFERVGEIITNAPPGGPTSIPESGGDLSMYYLVTFDPTLGYPTVIEQHPNTGPEPQIADADIVYRVESLEVLEPAIPGMPTTGEPKP
jgi:hypothetical protein